jgi:hypothetical protein
MIELHGQEAWDAAVAEQQARVAAGGDADSIPPMSAPTRNAPRLATGLANAAPIGIGVAVLFTLLSLTLIIARGVSPTSDPQPC